MPAPGDLLNRRFEKANFGGYKASDVDGFMVEVATAMSQANRENTELKRKLELTEKKLAELENEEDSLKSTLLSAQRLADKIVKDAQQSAELTLQDARIKAENLIERASDEISLRQNEADRIKREVSDFKLKLMRLYREHIELINTLPSEDKDAQEEKAEEAAETTPIVEEAAPIAKTAAEVEAKTQAQAAFVAVEPPKPVEAQQTAAPEIEETPEVTEEPETTEEPAISEEPETIEEPEDFEEPEEIEEEAAAEESPVVKLNLRYNEKTGEYEPIHSQNSGDTGFDADYMTTDGLKFGVDYDVRSDRFKDEPPRRGPNRR